MKKIILTAVLLMSPLGFATDFGDSYMGVTKAICGGAEGTIVVNKEAQTNDGVLNSNGRSMTLSFDRLKGEAPEYKVELIRDFLSSGYDLLGSPVVSKDGESFGTFAIVLDKMLTPSEQEMTVIYVEAMTGWQANMTMTCQFQ